MDCGQIRRAFACLAIFAGFPCELCVKPGFGDLGLYQASPIDLRKRYAFPADRSLALRLCRRNSLCIIGGGTAAKIYLMHTEKHRSLSQNSELAKIVTNFERESGGFGR